MYMNNNYNKLLTRYNVALRLPLKKVFEKYSGYGKMELGKNYTMLFPKEETYKGFFVRNEQFKELVFEITEPKESKGKVIPFVEFVCRMKEISYMEALEQINKEFGLKLVDNEETNFKDINEDQWLAKTNGILEKAFNPKTDTPKEDDKGFVYLNGIELIGPGGIGMIIGQPGAGKSSLCDTLCAKFNNKTIDAFGFEFIVPDTSKLLCLDMERADRLIKRSYEKILERSQLNKTTFQNRVEQLSYKAIVNRQPFENRKTRLERDIIKYKPSVVLIDGVAKLINDINNLNECVDFIRWLANLAEEYGIALLLTIHANPSDLKAQGHLGSVLLRECESVLALRYDKTKGGTQRELTTMFQHGKVRGGSDKVESWFEWSNEAGHFISAEKRTDMTDKANAEDMLKEIVVKAFEGVQQLTYKELGERMAKVTGKSYDTERRKIQQIVNNGLVIKQDKLYELGVKVKDM